MKQLEKLVVGGGCFWCVEAMYEGVVGVESVVSGYAGGWGGAPTYEEVCGGKSGHAEVVDITFDAAIVSREALLKLFWKAHDPTTLNRQGADVGTQYRSVIFFRDEAQKLAAEKSRSEAQTELAQPIVTEIVPLEAFHPAEEYHQDYFRRNPTASYCQFVIRPKLEKVEGEMTGK
jgi:peptide-methionine (S)-S-oxide reductase